jgi:hypothetical protein
VLLALANASGRACVGARDGTDAGGSAGGLLRGLGRKPERRLRAMDMMLVLLVGVTRRVWVCP